MVACVKNSNLFKFQVFEYFLHMCFLNVEEEYFRFCFCFLCWLNGRYFFSLLHFNVATILHNRIVPICSLFFTTCHTLCYFQTSREKNRLWLRPLSIKFRIRHSHLIKMRGQTWSLCLYGKVKVVGTHIPFWFFHSEINHLPASTIRWLVHRVFERQT